MLNTEITVRNKEKTHQIKLGEAKLEQVDRFKYLGSVVLNNRKLDEDIME